MYISYKFISLSLSLTLSRTHTSCQRPWGSQRGCVWNWPPSRRTGSKRSCLCRRNCKPGVFGKSRLEVGSQCSSLPPSLPHTHSELAWASGTELQQRMDSVTEDRDSTLQQAQELADQLLAAEQKRDELQGSLASAQGQVNELQVQLHDLNKRQVALEQQTLPTAASVVYG